MTTETQMKDWLTDAILEYPDTAELDEREQLQSVMDFRSAGFPGDDEGLVVELGDGSQFKITIKKTS